MDKIASADSTLDQVIADFCAPYQGLSHIAVGVSGGADSLALLFLMKGWCRRHDIRLTALTVNHGLRADAADEAHAVAALCETHGIPHEILTLPRDTIGITRIQEAARRARYNIMADWCRKNGAGALLTAHHLDDQAETFLMRLARGSGIRGLCGIGPVRKLDGVMLLRPLLTVEKAALTAYCRAHDLTWTEDPSNLNPRFDRARLRDQAAALMALGLVPVHIEKSRAKLQAAQDYIDFEKNLFLQKHTSVQDEEHHIDKKTFDTLHPYLQAVVLEDVLTRTGKSAYPPRHDALMRLCADIAQDFAGATLHGCTIKITRGNLVIAKEKSAL